MTPRITALAAAALLTLGTPLTPPTAHAGELSPRDRSSVMTVLVISSPLLFAMSAVAGASDAIGKSTASSATDSRSTGKLPAMEVKKVDATADGGRTVTLQDPTNAENKAQLQWPAGQEALAEQFVVGELVSFDPTTAGAGWTVQSPQGEVLAFVPTVRAAETAHSATW